jgi:hypothetical protein
LILNSFFSDLSPTRKHIYIVNKLSTSKYYKGDTTLGTFSGINTTIQGILVCWFFICIIILYHLEKYFFPKPPGVRLKCSGSKHYIRIWWRSLFSD